MATISNVHHKLESTIKETFECENACLVTNGTHAIEIVLAALDLPLGSRVLVPQLSFFATATAVARVGLIPVYADVQTEYLGISAAEVERSISTKDVRAVVLVHLAGIVNPEVEKIAQLCRDKAIPLIEDCAQCHLGRLGNVQAGNFGDAATFSFQSSKLFNCGEGGAVTTRSADLMKACKALINWGLYEDGKPGAYHLPSSNFRMSELQCEVLLTQLRDSRARLAALHEKAGGFLDAAASRFVKTLPFSFGGERTDSPFFVVATDVRPLFRLEPRSQYPMANSSVVKSILQKWFPAMVSEYEELNQGPPENSLLITETFAFLRISQYDSNESFLKDIAELAR